MRRAERLVEDTESQRTPETRLGGPHYRRSRSRSLRYIRSHSDEPATLCTRAACDHLFASKDLYGVPAVAAGHGRRDGVYWRGDGLAGVGGPVI